MRKEWKLPARDGRDVENIANKPSAVNTETGKNKKLSFFDAIPILKQGSEVAIDTLLTKFGLRENGNSSRFDEVVHTKEMLRQNKTWHTYGGFQDVSEALSMSGWTKVTNATNNLFVGLEADGFSLVDDGIIVANAGDYVGNVALTFIGSTTKDYHMRVYNVTQATQMGYVVGASGLGVGNYQHLVLPLYLECNAGDELQLEVIEAADTALTATDCVFYISYLHD